MRSRAMRRVTLRYLWDRIRVGLWFVPLMMAIAAFCLSWTLIWVDGLIPNDLLNDSRFILAGTSTEVRTIMVGIAGTILATTGVVFSLLTLPLSTVAAQYGSRLLRIFMRDQVTQSVLGIFVGTFCYCIATALAIPYNQTAEDVPQIAVTFGLVLLMASFASLIVLIQHISIMLQAPNIVARAGAELTNAVQVEIPEAAGELRMEVDKRVIDSLVESEAYPLRAHKKGYIQFVDPEIILNLAKDKDMIIRLLRKPGQFVSPDEMVALIWPAAKIDARLGKQMQRAVQIGNQRTPTQDVEYAINQLVEVAVRAMSPAINDPFTAITCLDHLADGLSIYVRSGEANPNFYDQDGKLRLIFEPATLVELLHAAFDMLRHASCDNATVLLNMLDAIDAIGKETKSDQARQELLHHVQLVQAESQAGALVETDKQQICMRCEMLGIKLKTEST